MIIIKVKCGEDGYLEKPRLLEEKEVKEFLLKCKEVISKLDEEKINKLRKNIKSKMT